MLSVRGTASAALKQNAERFIQAVASADATVNTILTNRNIRLLVLVDALGSDSSDDADQNTRIEWLNLDTCITITLPVDETGAGMHSGLLHELILHAVPAALKHAAAVSHGNTPVYPATDHDIEVEETLEHQSRAGWQLMADIAVDLEDEQLLSRAVIDAANHDGDIAQGVIAELLRTRKINQDYADDLLSTIFPDDDELSS